MKSRTLVSILLLSVLGLPACKTQGDIQGDVTSAPGSSNSTSTSASTDAGSKTSMPKPAAAKHEHVVFTWESSGGSHSGKIYARLPDGEMFSGQFHEVTADTAGGSLDGFYSSWYGGPWGRYDWTWGGDWPYYGTAVDYVSYYTNHVVALLDGDQGTTMRCHFTLDDSTRGMKSGGEGHCQLSSGEWITAVFAST